MDYNSLSAESFYKSILSHDTLTIVCSPLAKIVFSIQQCDMASLSCKPWGIVRFHSPAHLSQQTTLFPDFLHLIHAWSPFAISLFKEMASSSLCRIQEWSRNVLRDGVPEFLRGLLDKGLAVLFPLVEFTYSHDLYESIPLRICPDQWSMAQSTESIVQSG